jgi:glycosyltransferase involved in cell wall biosynthesis
LSIRFVCEWDKVKEKTWSGTNYSLYKAMKQKKDVIDAGFHINEIENKILKILNIKIKKGKINTRSIYNENKLKIYEKNLNKIQVDKNNDCVFEISDLGKMKDCPYYIYQDLSIDFLINCQKTNPEAFKYSGFQNALLEDLEKRREKQISIYKDASGIFTMSNFLANHLVEYTKLPKEKVHFVGGGINLDLANIKPIEKENNKILFVGRDFYRKGGDLVCEAFKILKNKYLPNVQLYIAGAPKKIKNEYKDYNDIYFLGDLKRQELSKYFNMCDIFCMPSRFEAYGIVFIEALTYGLPCIGRNSFAMKEFIENGKTGYLIENDDLEELAGKMKDLLENNKIKNNVKNRFEYYKNNYSWNSVADRVFDVIEKDKNINK